MDAERLEPIDAAFLSLDGPVTTGHMCLVVILDGPTTLDALRSQLEVGLERVPVLRRRLHGLGFGLDRPWWVDDADFDINEHLVEADLPAPHDGLTLASAAALIDQEPLDRSRPLWQIHLLHHVNWADPSESGVSPGTREASTEGTADADAGEASTGGTADAGEQCAIVIKVHHAAVDGIGARDLLAQLFPAPTPSRASDHAWAPKPVPSAAALVLHSAVDTEGALGTAVRWENRASREVTEVAQKVTQVAQKVTGLATSLVDRRVADRLAPTVRHLFPQVVARPPQRAGQEEKVNPAHRWFNAAPASIINRAITRERTWAFTTLPLADVAALRAQTGSTVNDVILAATAGGLRAWLLEEGELPRRPLVAMVPISMRPVGQEPRSGNQIALTLCDLPTHLGDPLTRLTVVRGDMAEAKAAPSMSQTLLEDVARVTAPALTRLVTGGFYALGLAERVRLPFNLIVSNVPAGRRSGMPGGRRVLGTYPLPPLSDGMGLNLTVQGRDGRLDVGLCACPELVADVWHVLDLIRQSYDELGGLAGTAAQRAMG